MAFLTASEHWACWTCHLSLWVYLFKADRMNTCLHIIKLSEWQTWIFKTSNLFVCVLLECFILCPKKCGVRFFGSLLLPTVIGYDKTCQEKNYVMPWNINLHDNSESSRCESQHLIKASDMNMLWTRRVVFSYWDFRRENFHAWGCCLQPYISNISDKYTYILSKQNPDQGLGVCRAEAV